VRAADGRGPRTALTEAVLAHWSLETAEGLLERAHRMPLPRAEIAGLARLVEAAAAEGDAAAAAIVGAAGRELALAAKTAVRAVALASTVPAALAGGVLVHGRAVRGAFFEALAGHGLTLDPAQLVSEPAVGGIEIARRLAEEADPART
jgi:N-acetylglucosamine kinase-like BadF-type ATPase